jgi:hypothetical protein
VAARLGAIWPRSEALTVERGEVGKTKGWSFFVRPRREGEQKENEGISLRDLVREAPIQRIDLPKIDIEGGEQERFSTGFEPWLSCTRTIVIELHGPPACQDIFLRAIVPFRFRVEDVGFVTIARQESPGASA